MDPFTARRHTQAGIRAMHTLTLGNLRLVGWVLRSFRFGMAHHADLLQQGFLGLHRAATGFDPERDNRFSTYASWWIFQSTMAYLGDQGRVVRIPRHLSGDLHKVRRARVRLFGQGGLSGGAEIERIAADLGFEPVKVALLLALQADATSLSTQVGEDGTELGALLVDTRVEEPTRNLEREELAATLQRCMADLDDRSRAVIELRYGLGGSEPLTLEELGLRLGITRERVRQIEAKALERLRFRDRSTPLEAFLEDAA
jgi:RNA polymerase primary sigma factor